MRRIKLIIALLFPVLLYAQEPVTLQSWMEVEGTYNGQRLGNNVGFAGKFGDTTTISAADKNGLYLYYVTTPLDTVFKIYYPGGYNCLLGDFNGDGIEDLVVQGNPTKIYPGITPGIFDTIPFFVKHKEPEGYAFGLRAAVGKINGDSYDDLIIADGGYPNGNNIGRVYIFFGGISMDTTTDYILNGNSIRQSLGRKVETGDLNNDGFDDVIVKGYDSNNPISSQRFPYIKIFLGGNEIDTIPWKHFRGDLTSSFGLACFDVNWDGVKDLLWTNYSTSDSSNAVYIHYSQNNDIDTIPSLKLLHPWAANVTNAGDMNGDGYDDILISSNSSDQGGNSYIFVYSGGPNMDANFDAAVGIGGVSNLGAIGSIAGIGDINNDGYGDILVGAPSYQWFTEKGKWYIFLGDSNIHVTSVIKEDDFNKPEYFQLFQNYPNPFNPSTKIKYVIAKEQHIIFKVFDILGNEIITMVNEAKSAGEYEVEFDGSGLSSGIYFYKLTAINNEGEQSTETKQMILLK